MTPLSFETFYGSMIAGSVPTHAGDVEQSIAYIAIDALQTSAIHYHFAHPKDVGRAFFLAVPSKTLSSTPNPTTPLTAAIPGSPNHQGEGAYIVYADELAAAAVFMNGDLRVFMNTREVLDRHLAEIGATVFDVNGLEGGQLDSVSSRGRRAGEKLSSVVSKVSVFGVGLGVFVSFGLALANGYFEGRVEDQYLARSQALAKVSEEMNFSSPLSQQVSRLHTIATVAIKGDGYIKSFKHAGGITTYEMAVKASYQDEASKRLDKTAAVEIEGGMAVFKFSDGAKAAPAAAAPASGASAATSKPDAKPAKKSKD
jgi:hypothetical protein